MDQQATLAPESSNVAPPAGPSGFQPVASYLHTALMVLLMAGVAYLSARTLALRAEAHDVRGPLGQYISTIIWLWALAALVYLGMRLRKVPVSEVVGGRWATFDAFLIDLAIAGGFWLGAVLILGLISTAIDPSRLKAAAGGSLPESVKSLAPLIPHTKLEILFWILMSISAGICEEFVFRGYLQRQFSALTRNAALGIILSAAVFAIGHMYQGGKQMIVIGVFGAMFGTLAYFRKSLRAGMIAHAWNDIFDGLVLSLFSHLLK